MAVSTVISSARPGHRTARVMYDAFQGCLALDWANGQALALSGANAQTTAFDANNDRIVMVSVGGNSSVGGAWITVAANPIATAGAQSMWVPQNDPQLIYVPAAMLIGAIQGQTGGTLSAIPALLAGS